MKKLLLFIFAFSFLAFSSLAQTIEFFDDFESGTTNWELTGTWGLTAAESYSADSSLTESPGGDYDHDLNINATMLNGVDLSNALSAELSFWAIYMIELGFDYMFVDVSIDDFVTFTQLDVFDGEDNLLPWEQFTYSLGGFVGNDNVKIRFRFESDQGYATDGMYIDDFTITSFDEDLAPPLVTFNEPEFYEGALDEYEFVATIIDISGVASAVCTYTVDGAAQSQVPGTNTSGNEWVFVIPTQDPGAWVEFVIEATDSSVGQNTTITDTSKYISGKYYSYDNSIISFWFPVGAGYQSQTVTGVSVMITLDDTETPVTSLIRNYTDVDHANDDIDVHIWTGDGSGPVADLIAPITMTPEATLENTSAMTRVDLRPYYNELASLSGTVFIGFTVPANDDVAFTVTTNPGIAGQSFTLNAGTWASADVDYHFRLITDGGKLSTQNTNPDIDFKVYPNPAHNYIRISAEENINQLCVYNLLGMKIEIRDVDAKETFVNTSAYKKGLYILQLHTNKGVVNAKFEVR